MCNNSDQVVDKRVVKRVRSFPIVKPSMTGLIFLILLTSTLTAGQPDHREKRLDGLEHFRNKMTSNYLLSTGRPDLFEGDIKLEEKGSSRASVNKKIYLWPGGIVPYVFDSGLSRKAQTAIKSAIKTMESLSCVRFKFRTGEAYYVKFISGNGCYSCIGRVRKGQEISIGNGCEREGIVLHELMHTMGFFHTNSRPDRDAYIFVFSQNILPGFERNFQKYSHGEVDRLRAPYDVTSIMHLPKNSWSKNGQNTMESRAGTQVTLGQRNGLSVVDRQQLNQLYKCSANHGCYFAMGFEKQEIKDSQLTASSSKKYYEPHQARLHLTAGAKGNGAWCAAGNQIDEYLQVDLGSRYKVTAIATQGMTSLFLKAWVSSYKVQSSDNGLTYSWVTDIRYLAGNWDANSVQYNALKTPIRARFIRIIPTHWYNGICLRVEMYGCK